MQHPLRRILIIEALNSIDSDSYLIIKFFKNAFESLFELLTDLLDGVGTAIVNCHLKKPIKHLFRKQQKEVKSNIIKTPYGIFEDVS